MIRSVNQIRQWLPWLILLDSPSTVGQKEVEDGREDEVEEGDGGGPDEVKDGPEVREGESQQ